MPGGGVIGPGDPIPVQLTWTDVREVAVPDLVRLLGHRDPVRLDGRIPPVEQT